MLYHKIQTVFKRDFENNYKTLLKGEFSVPEFSYLKNNEWEFTEKIDGTNIRVVFEEGVVYFKGRKDKSQILVPLLQHLEHTFIPIQDIFGSKGVCLYGEGYGPGIQKGGKYRNSNSFILFDVMINGIWLSRKDVEDIAKMLKIDAVPVVASGTLHHMVTLVEQGFDSVWGNFEVEGIVARPKIELLTRNGDRVITKLKCKDFKYGYK